MNPKTSIQNKIKQRPDYILSVTIFILAIFGLIMISSASVVRSMEISNGQSSNVFLIKQAIALGIGLIAWIVMQKIDYHKLKDYALWFLIGSLILMLLVFVPGLSKNFYGAQRWIGYGPAILQPSEILKLSLIIYLSAWFSKNQDEISNFWKIFLPFLLLLAIVVALIMKQPDLGTMMIVIFTGLIIFFAANGPIWEILMLIPIGGVALWVLIKAAPYRMARILAFINPSDDKFGIAYHVNQAMIAIGSGGLWGLGYGASKQKFNYLPQASSDSIFAIIAEELGFVRTIFVIFAFVVVALRGFNIAKNAPDVFGRLLAIGITSWIVFQAIINIAAMLGMVPLTGVPLPFISQGGSSLVILLASVGILLNVSKQTRRD